MIKRLKKAKRWADQFFKLISDIIVKIKYFKNVDEFTKARTFDQLQQQEEQGVRRLPRREELVSCESTQAYLL